MLAWRISTRCKFRGLFVNKIKVITGDNFIWNKAELIEFLSKHQGGDIVIDLNCEGPSAESVGLYRLLDAFSFASVTVLTANVLESHSKYNIVCSELRFAKVREPINAQHHQWNQTKLFSAFYGRPIWHRLGLAGFLKVHHSKQSLVNLRGDYYNEDSRKLFEMTQLFKSAPAQWLDFAQIATQTPLMIETSDGYAPGTTDTSGYTKQLLKFYEDILIDVVAETYTSGNTFFPTEKTFRPILMKKPFIAMGPINQLIYLRQMGFKTFYEYWNEDYDGYKPQQKFHKILEVINSISAKSTQELHDMYVDMQHILDYNYHLLLSQSYNTNIEIVND